MSNQSLLTKIKTNAEEADIIYDSIHLYYEAYLLKIENSFSVFMDQVQQDTEKLLDKLDKNDTKGRVKILMDQKRKISKTTDEFNQALKRNESHMNADLETVDSLSKNSEANLEDELSNI